MSRYTNRLYLIGLWAIPLLLMLSAWLLYYAWYIVPGYSYLGATSNRGELIQPPLALNDVLSWPEQHWSVLIMGDAICKENCREILYTTRQLHIALGREAWRVQRIYYSGTEPPSSELMNFIANQHPGMQVVYNANQAYRLDGLPKASYYLIDPQAFAMMAYDERHKGADTLLDLKFLLKFSH